MTLPSPKICRKIVQLHALIGSPNANEAEAARQKLTEVLVKHGLTWNDLPRILSAIQDADGRPGDRNTNAAPSPKTDAVPEFNVLDLLLGLLEKYISITSEERMAVALWILHAWVFDRFTITPRLALLSPVRGCGKTVLLCLIKLLLADAFRTDNATPAALYHHLDRHPYAALLVDEGDNLDLLRNPILRAVFNAGHRSGGSIDRFIGGRPRKFHVFAPLAIAAIGTLPLPLLHRSVAINMQRPSGETTLERLDERSPIFGPLREQIRRWAATCSLTPDPDMPMALRNRAADNWRLLISIAESLGHGDEARVAATKLSSNRLYEDVAVILLEDIRAVFDELKVDRIASVLLVSKLVSLNDGAWAEWRGPKDDRPPHKLTQGELATLLRDFQIRPKTVWPRGRQSGDRSSRGYLRSQFEAAWRAYCPSADTATQPPKVIDLPHRATAGASA
jgi:hypothetical protein